jgi:hypothetical protein
VANWRNSYRSRKKNGPLSNIQNIIHTRIAQSSSGSTETINHTEQTPPPRLPIPEKAKKIKKKPGLFDKLRSLQLQKIHRSLKIK